jgi:hypothetical protein
MAILSQCVSQTSKNRCTAVSLRIEASAAVAMSVLRCGVEVVAAAMLVCEPHPLSEYKRPGTCPPAAYEVEVHV